MRLQKQQHFEMFGLDLRWRTCSDCLLFEQQQRNEMRLTSGIQARHLQEIHKCDGIENKPE